MLQGTISTRLRPWLEGDLLLRLQEGILEITVEVMLAWGELTGGDVNNNK